MRMIKIQSNGNAVQLFSSYEHKDKCTAIPGGKWNPKVKCWEYPPEAIFDIKELFNNNFEASSELITEMKSLEYREEVLNAIKQKKFPLDEHEFLMYHQRQCRAIARYYPHFAFFLDTGTGKTLTALQIAQDRAVKTLVVCPKSIIKSAWVEDKDKWFEHMKMLPLSRNMSKKDYELLAETWALRTCVMTKDKLKTKLSEHAQIYVVNPETFRSDLKDIQELGIQQVIIDESTTVKNPHSLITKAITGFAGSMASVYIMSGKPAPNNQLDYFAQMRLIDPSLLGNSFFAFRNKYFDSDYMGYNFTLKPGADVAIANRIARKSIFIRKEDCLDLPDKTYIARRVEIPADLKKTYKQMETAQLATLLDSDTPIFAPNKASAIMKLRQLVSGFIIDNDEIVELSNYRLRELEDTIEELGDHQVIIWAQFKHEMRSIEKMLQRLGKSVVTAYSETKDLDGNIKAFKNSEVQYIVAHPKTLKYGVTFVNCTYAVYYSMSYDYEEYYQSHDRIYRKGQTKPCTFIKIMAEESIDEDIAIANENKGGIALVIENLARRVGG